METSKNSWPREATVIGGASGGNKQGEISDAVEATEGSAAEKEEEEEEARFFDSVECAGRISIAEEEEGEEGVSSGAGNGMGAAVTKVGGGRDANTEGAVDQDVPDADAGTDALLSDPPNGTLASECDGSGTGSALSVPLVTFAVCTALTGCKPSSKGTEYTGVKTCDS